MPTTYREPASLFLLLMALWNLAHVLLRALPGYKYRRNFLPSQTCSIQSDDQISSIRRRTRIDFVMPHSTLSRTNDDSDNHLGREPQRDSGQRHIPTVNHGPSTYVLQGYDCYFLNSRSITFVEPLPRVRVCAGCSVVPARAVQLPCGHTLCELCEYDAFVRAAAEAQPNQVDSTVAMHHGGVCPEDGTPFAEFELRILTFSMEQLHRHVTLCVNARFGCSFQAELKQLKEHCFSDCCVRRKTCRYCGKDNILACDTEQHSRRCLPW
ncbi:hypothetical protein HPB49_024056 [Dermacentor silvarum]|uniref:Uncharacterized protein n=1 Tax=Dermacentor silvarum TaxID=543639 RepID=A0ACB8DRL5_DERSI|nr:hypothetical protein HPB49_024056 [Dermacentor silvarum]